MLFRDPDQWSPDLSLPLCFGGPLVRTLPMIALAVKAAQSLAAAATSFTVVHL